LEPQLEPEEFMRKKMKPCPMIEDNWIPAEAIVKKKL